MRTSSILAAAVVFLLLQAFTAGAQTMQDRLFQRVVAGTKCETIPNNGRYCKYQIASALQVGIKDVGGTDTVVGFHNSNIQKEFYAVMYFGCIGIVPGESHPKHYGREYGVFISPKTGLVYRTSNECQSTLK
jgi:hypothetical protein